jgi:hypothetical protein
MNEIGGTYVVKNKDTGNEYTLKVSSVTEPIDTIPNSTSTSLPSPPINNSPPYTNPSPTGSTSSIESQQTPIESQQTPIESIDEPITNRQNNDTTAQEPPPKSNEDALTEIYERHPDLKELIANMQSKINKEKVPYKKSIYQKNIKDVQTMLKNPTYHDKYRQDNIIEKIRGGKRTMKRRAKRSLKNNRTKYVKRR